MNRPTPQTAPLLYQEIPAICLELDRDLQIREINRFGCGQLGYSQAELCGRPYSELCLEQERAYVEQNLRQCLNELGSLRRWECSLRRADGSSFWVRDTVRVVERPDGSPAILVVCEDITEIRYLVNELETKSSTDELTGLYNRRRFNLFLDELLLSVQNSDQQHILFFIDLDQFKAVNDSCGHLCGDAFLRQVAQILKRNIRSQDILARLGGDEFGLLLTSCSPEEAIQVGNKLLKALAQARFSWRESLFSISASIGGTPINRCTDQRSSTLLEQADAACYLAKESGRNRLRMYDDDNTLIEARSGLQSWYTRILEALEQDRFVLYAQRIVALSGRPDDGLDTYEILIRLDDGDGGIIPPAAFIPAAEYYNITARIDRWVVETLLRQHDSLRPSRRIRYFVNLSGLTLGNREFIEVVSQLLSEGGRTRPEICFEITESAAIHNLESASRFIDTFHALGCRFALDDFGSGFCSFGYLRTLPVDVIKIDGEFVRDIANDLLDQAVVRAIHEVARVFGKLTVAEYVESEATYNMLRGMGVDYAQGYFTGRPEPLAGIGGASAI